MAAGGVLVGRGYVSIRPEFEGDWSRSVNARASSAGRSGAGAFGKAFGAGMKTIGGLAAVAISANISGVAASAAALAPALATAGTAAAALKIGLSGVGDAFKAAFADTSAQASSAASATRAVEGAQRSLANAQRSLADARVQAAERVKEAQRAVADAERNLGRTVEESAQRQRDAQVQVQDAVRDLRSAQVDAREAQLSLTDARREATRTLEDMNQRLAESQLDEREAILRLKQAEDELKAAQLKPGTTPEQLAKLQLAYDRAKLNLTEQRRETQRLAVDTRKANKAGVDGSKEVAQAQGRIVDANESVADKQRALARAQDEARQAGVDGARAVADAQRDLADAQAGVAKAHQDGARQIEDAQRAVADAAAAVADAQAAAAAQTSQLDKAMSKLAPNAQSFVKAIQGLAPAWRDMRLSVQNRLFDGLDTAVTQLGRQTIPILQRQLTVTAGIWNGMAKSAMGAVSEMAKTGMLEEILAGSNRAFAQFKDAPGQLITAFGHLSLAAQPAFERMMGGFASAIAGFSERIAASFQSGGLQEGIETAFGILSQLGHLLANVFGVVSQIFKAASDAGGEILGVLSAVFEEIGRILALPQVQAQLRTLFASVAQIVGALVPVLGALVQAVVPIMAAIAPAVAAIATALGPVLSQLATVLGAALMPIITALMPVVEAVGLALVQVVSAITPLLGPIASVLTLIIQALMPVVAPIVSLVTQLVSVLVGPLMSVVQALTPLITMLGEIFAQVFGALAPLLGPIVTMVAQLATIFATVFSQALNAVIAAIMPLVPVVTELIGVLVAGLMPVVSQIGTALADVFAAALPPLIGGLLTLMEALNPLWPLLTQIMEQVVGLGTQLLTTLLPVVPALATALGSLVESAVALLVPLAGVAATLMESLGPVIAQLAPVVAQLASVLAGALAAALPPLTQALLILIQSLNPLWPLIGEIIAQVVGLGAELIATLLPPLMQLITAAVGLVVALMPILPPLAEIIGLVVQLAVQVLSWLLPPLISLASFLVGILAGALGTAIGWLAGLVGILTTVVMWVTTKLGPSLTWLWEHIFRPVFGWIGDKAQWLWNEKIKPAWDLIKAGTKLLGDKIKQLWNEYAKPVFGWIGDKGKWLWDKALKPAFDNVKRGIKAVGDSFEDAKKFIEKAWSKVESIAKKPVKFLVNTLYNGSIVPTWNKIATAFGANPIKPMVLPKNFATGGILPGYTPGKDVHTFHSRTGGSLALSGGEAIMRPEWTRAVGSRFVDAMNRIASTRGAPGVKAALAPALGGNPLPSQQYKDGGIFSWIGSKAAGVGSAAWDGIKKGADWLTDGLESSARAGLKYVVDPLLKIFPGADTNFGAMIRRIPHEILDAIFGYSKTADKKGAGGIGGPRIQAALKWARTQHGLPYQWGGNGNPSWDCSGFMSAIESVIRGQKPHRRWATGSFSGRRAPGGWVLNGKSPFQVGITNAGVGHTAGTLGKVNVESRGGDGVVVGKRARGANAMMFRDVYGFQPGKYDSGGYLQPGLNLAYNGTGRPEPVFTSQQANALTRMGADGGFGDLSVSVYVGDREITDIARTEIHRSNGELLSTIRAGRKG